MALTEDTYAITTPRRPGVIHSISPALSVHDLSFGAQPGSASFDSFALAAVAGDTTERTVVAGSVGVVYFIRSLLLAVFTGTTAPAATRYLSLLDGSGGTEIGRINIPPEKNWCHEYWCVFEGPTPLTISTGLFCVLDGALGTGSGYTVCGSFWKE